MKEVQNTAREWFYVNDRIKIVASMDKKWSEQKYSILFIIALDQVNEKTLTTNK